MAKPAESVATMPCAEYVVVAADSWSSEFFVLVSGFAALIMAQLGYLLYQSPPNNVKLVRGVNMVGGIVIGVGIAAFGALLLINPQASATFANRNCAGSQRVEVTIVSSDAWKTAFFIVLAVMSLVVTMLQAWLLRAKYGPFRFMKLRLSRPRIPGGNVRRVMPAPTDVPLAGSPPRPDDSES